MSYKNFLVYDSGSVSVGGILSAIPSGVEMKKSFCFSAMAAGFEVSSPFTTRDVGGPDPTIFISLLAFFHMSLD